ncbi:MAG: TolC family protein [Candidatus Eisenbacteria sp.]|nr:TolC family protein [Candidatus Eisenbacteria bacterium]
MAGFQTRSAGFLVMHRVAVFVLLCVWVGPLSTEGARAADWSDLEGRKLTLHECISIARENSPALAKSLVGVRYADAGVGQAWASVLPKVSNYFSYYRFDEPRFYLTGYGLDASDTRYTSLLRVEQSLFKGGGNVAGISSARAALRAAENDQRSAEQGLDLDVEARYIELLQGRALLRVRQETVDLSEQHVMRAEAFYRAGEKTQADVLRARVELAQNHLELISARNAVQTARATLAYTLGISVDTELDVIDLPDPVLTGSSDLDREFQDATRLHPLLASRRFSVESSKASITVAKSSRWPSVTAAWDYQWNDFELPRFRGDHHRWGANDEWWIRLSMGFNIFDGRLTKSNIRRAEAGLQYAREDYKQALSDVLLGVKKAHLDLTEAQEKIRAAEEAVVLGEEDRRLQAERYRLGEGTLLELNDALVALTKARVSKITAIYDYHLAKARLDWAVGRG